MARFFSRSRGGFFDEAIHGALGEEGSLIPSDAQPVEAVAYTALLAEQATGKRIVGDAAGAPVAVVPTLSPEELLAAARARRDRELAKTDWTQLGDAALSEAQRQLWAQHRQALRDLPAAIEAAIEAGLPADSVHYPTAPEIAAPSRTTDQTNQEF